MDQCFNIKLELIVIIRSLNHFRLLDKHFFFLLSISIFSIFSISHKRTHTGFFLDFFSLNNLIEKGTQSFR